MAREVRLGVDIGGTFTDVALEVAGTLFPVKVPTTQDAPARAVLDGVALGLRRAQAELRDVSLFVHGTTLAANALIERKGARTALLTSDGFRDVLEMGNEGRFDQYDTRALKPLPLVPREWRFTVPERLRADGAVERPLDEAAVRALAPKLAQEGIEAIAIGFLHSYLDGSHERRAAQILAGELPGVWISTSHEVSPQMREYERLSTTCANAYIQPVMSRYLLELERELRERGLRAPMMMILSGGGVATIETAARFPIRLLESGPAGGAIFASTIARENGYDEVLSFDLGGTTAKFCMIDSGRARTAMNFEIARTYRFKRGSGLPVRIPVVDLVEIGAGGGSIARLDGLGRITVGPDSAGSDPGPASYARGGTQPTVTDCDIVLGKIDPDSFAGGSMRLDAVAATRALGERVARRAGVSDEAAAYAVSETVAETMAAAARVHATECGAEVDRRTMIAFGGAAPLHAARFADRLGIDRIIVPVGASVGSAIGFLQAPVAYEIVRSANVILDERSVPDVARIADEAEAEAAAFVKKALPEGTPLTRRRSAYMRYRGQGHEIEVVIPESEAGWGGIRDAYDETYARIYGRTIPEAPAEVTSVSVTVSDGRHEITAVPDENSRNDRDPAQRGGKAGRLRQASPAHPPAPARQAAKSAAERRIYDAPNQAWVNWPVYERAALLPGCCADGPAIITEPDTTTVVPPHFRFEVDASHYLVLERRKG